MAGLRLFFALELGEAARRAAAAAAERLAGPDWRPLREEALHVTLRFLGDVADERVPALVAAVGEAVAGAEPFRLALGGPLAIPSARRPRVLALGLEPAGPLAALAAAVERGAVAAGFPAEARPFRGHVTLARLRAGRRPRGRPDGFAGVTGSVTAAGHAWEVREVVLLQSRLSQQGARYTPLERISLHP